MSGDTKPSEPSGQWHIETSQGVQGPFNLQQIKSLYQTGKITGEDVAISTLPDQRTITVALLMGLSAESTHEAYGDEDPVTDLFNTLQAAKEKTTTRGVSLAPSPATTEQKTTHRLRWGVFVTLGSMATVAAVHWMTRKNTEPTPGAPSPAPTTTHAATPAPATPPPQTTFVNKVVKPTPAPYHSPARTLPQNGAHLVRPIEPAPSPEESYDRRDAREEEPPRNQSESPERQNPPNPEQESQEGSVPRDGGAPSPVKAPESEAEAF